MRALTVHPWWAALLMSGHKTTENRSWAPNLAPGEVFAVHAGSKRPGREDRERVQNQMVAGGLDLLELQEVMDAPRGVILGTITYAGCDDRVLSSWDLPELLHWRVCSPVLCKPIPCPGAMGLWRLPTHVAGLLMPNAAAPDASWCPDH